MPEADHPRDVGADDTRAMTYDALAKARNISRDSAIRLAQRRGWRQGRTNDGLVLVDVPVDALTRQDDAGGDDGGDGVQLQQPAGGDVGGNIRDDVGADVRGDIAHVTAAIEAAASGWWEALARADAETARERAKMDSLAHQVRGTEANIRELLARAERAQAEAQAARQEATAVVGELDRLRADLERATAGAQAAQGRVDALRQEIDAAKAGSLPRRVWRAIRGR